MTLSLPSTDFRQLLPLADATAAVMCGSVFSFYRWCKKWRVTAFRHGQYRRQDLIDGLAREEQAKAKRRGRK